HFLLACSALWLRPIWQAPKIYRWTLEDLLVAAERVVVVLSAWSARSARSIRPSNFQEAGSFSRAGFSPFPPSPGRPPDRPCCSNNPVAPFSFLGLPRGMIIKSKQART